MQLILAEAVGASVANARDREFALSYIVCAQTKSPTGTSHRDDYFISMMTQGESSVLCICLSPENDTVVISSYENEKGFNLFKSLRERFQERVRISLEISRKDFIGDDCIQFGVAVENGMAVDGNDYCCRAEVYHIEDFMGLGFANSEVNVKVIAHINDDDELVPPNVSSETIQKILENGESSDVIIVAKNASEIKSHKTFLAASSSVFKAMFDNDMMESKTGRVVISDISEQGIRAFLQFIYSGKVIGLGEDIDIAFDVLCAARKYDVPKLEAIMKTYLLARKDDDFGAGIAFKIYLFMKSPGPKPVESDSGISLATKMIRVMSLDLGELRKLPEFREGLQNNSDDALGICCEVVEFLKRKFDDNVSVSVSLAFQVYLFSRESETAVELRTKAVQIMRRKFDDLKKLAEYQEVFQKNPADAMEICATLVTVSSPSKRKLGPDHSDQ